MEAFKKWLRAVKPRRTDFTAFSAGIALIVGTILFFEIRGWWKAPESKITEPRYLIAKREVKAGQRIAMGDFSARTHDASGSVPAGAFTDQDWPALEGRELRESLAPGDFLTRAIVFASHASFTSKIPKGSRAYTLPVETPIPVAQGDRVDLLFSSEGSKELPILLLNAVLVLSGAGEGEREGVTLAVTPEQLQLLEKAHQTGKLTLALRNPQEKSSALGERRPSSWRAAKKKPKIEIWSEGE